MPQPSSILWKLGSDSPPSNISGETSFAPRVLLDRVKPIWADAQGDHGVLSVDRVEPLSTGFCWSGLRQKGHGGVEWRLEFLSGMGCSLKENNKSSSITDDIRASLKIESDLKSEVSIRLFTIALVVIDSIKAKGDP